MKTIVIAILFAACGAFADQHAAGGTKTDPHATAPAPHGAKHTNKMMDKMDKKAAVAGCSKEDEKAGKCMSEKK